MERFGEPEVRALYEAFNARDIDAAVARMAPAVDWPNGMEGGRMEGVDAVRAYWTRQWALMDPRVDPVKVTDEEQGHVRVDVRQVVRDRQGALLAEGMVVHRYTADGDGRVTRMEILDPSTPARLLGSS